jgi:transketolase
MATLPQQALEARLKVLDIIYKAGTSHIGSNFSCIDIMAVIFDKIDLDKDEFVLSAGWKAASLYYFLHKKGFITEEELDSYCQDGSKFIGLAEPVIPQIKIAGGSMGLGLPGAVGLAMAKKFKGEEGIVYCLMSDGELQIGTTWESALIASQHKLDNLVVIVDNNGFQAMGNTDDILKVNFPDAGFNAHHLNGHDFDEIVRTITLCGSSQLPSVIIANTTKGKGVPDWENNNLWHYAQIKEDDYNYALSCLK